MDSHDNSSPAGQADSFRKSVWWALLIAVVCLIAGTILATSATPARVLHLHLESRTAGSLQIFFDLGAGFSEKHSQRVKYPRGRSALAVILPDQSVSSFRIDPQPPAADLTIHSLAVGPADGAPERTIPLSTLRAINEIASLDRVQGAVTVVPLDGGVDPQLLLPLDRPTQERLPLQSIAGIFWVIGLLIIGGAILRSATVNAGPAVAPMLGIALALIAAMSMTSPVSHPVHPDEFTHAEAARYYVDHWMPPAVDDPRIADSFDPVWGISYLNNFDVAYFFIGKGGSVLQGLGQDPIRSFRLLNALFFGLLAVVAWRYRSSRVGLAVLLVTPQIWYVFSYVNGDAFALFISMVAVLLCATVESPVSRFVRDGSRHFGALAAFVIAVGLLLVSKQNYLPVVFFIAMWLTVRHLHADWKVVLTGGVGAGLCVARFAARDHINDAFPDAGSWFLPVGATLLAACGAMVLRQAFRRGGDAGRPLFRLAVLFGLALAVAAPRIALDLMANGSPADKAVLKMVAAEKYAQPMFKPSLVEKNLAGTYPSLRLATKGIELRAVLGAPYHWVRSSWRSAFGVYGYMNVFAANWVYWVLTLGVGMILAGLLLWGPGNSTAWLQLLVLLVSAGLVVIAAMIFSWTYAFQGQGRYLLCIAPMLAAVMAEFHEQGMRSRLVALGIAGCFGMSVVSFLWWALPVLAAR